MLPHFSPITASRRLVHGVAAGLGVLATLVAHAIIFWGYAYRTHVSGWPTAMAIGVMVYFAVVRMSRERFLPLEDNVVSRLIARCTSRHWSGFSSTKSSSW